MQTRNAMKAYIHYGGVFVGLPKGPFQTVSAEAKRCPLWWQKQNLSFTASGYGKRIPTEYMVNVDGRWKRVYCCIFSNSGTCYIESNRKPIATVDIMQ